MHREGVGCIELSIFLHFPYLLFFFFLKRVLLTVTIISDTHRSFVRISIATLISDLMRTQRVTLRIRALLAATFI